MKNGDKCYGKKFKSEKGRVRGGATVGNRVVRGGLAERGPSGKDAEVVREHVDILRVDMAGRGTEDKGLKVGAGLVFVRRNKGASME